MSPDLMLAALYAFPAFALIIFLLQRLRWRLLRRGFYPTSVSLGIALQQLQAIAEPGNQHVLEEKLAEEAEDDDTGDPDSLDPTKHLLRQATRIRRGDPPDRLTAYLNRPER